MQHTNDLIQLLTQTREALECEAIDLVDMTYDDRGRPRPIVPEEDRDYFTSLTDQGAALYDLLKMIKARRDS